MKSAAYLPLFIALCLASSGCRDQSRTSNETNAATSETVEKPKPAAALPACPFGQTGDWHASLENGRILVNGRVDLMMAGFKPTLAPRQQASPGAIAFDLSLQQQEGAVVDERPRYEGRVSGRYSKAEIYCGGKLIQTIDVVQIG